MVFEKEGKEKNMRKYICRLQVRHAVQSKVQRCNYSADVQ
jgi:hypothetical protein